MKVPYPNPEWVGDNYVCEHGHITQRYRRPEDSHEWAGVVRCRTCNSIKTTLSAVGQPLIPIVLPFDLAAHRRSEPGGALLSGGLREDSPLLAKLPVKPAGTYAELDFSRLL